MDTAALLRKLKIKEGESLLVLNASQEELRWLDIPGIEIAETTAKEKHQNVVLFVRDRAELNAQCNIAVASTKNLGLCWFAYPKGTSKKKGDLNRGEGWEVVMALKYQWISLIALNDTWSAFAVRVGVPAKEDVAKEKKNLIALDGTVLIDFKTRQIATPKEFQEGLKKSPEALEFFEILSFTNKREYIEYVFLAKKEDTRAARLEKCLDYLKQKRKTPMNA